jgi:hypothetical protein
MPVNKKVYRVRLVKSLRAWPKAYWRKNIWHKLLCIFLAFIIVAFGAMYGIGEWYINSQSGQPVTLGVSFEPDYAESLGLNPQQTMGALLSIGVRQFRLDSYWSDLEPSPGQYNFSELDWEFQKAEAKDAKIILTLGLRQPNWPECHMPSWATNEPVSVWQPQLEAFMTAVINRYKDSPSLESYQLENEYFLKGFGTCTNYSRSRLVSEYNLVRKLDPTRPIIIGRSNNAIGFPVGQPQPNEFSITVYRRVWDANLTHRYLEYPFPAWYYGFLAGVQKIFEGRNMIIGELQTEAWAPDNKSLTQISLAEQNKSFNAARFTSTVNFAKATGMKEILLWGAEYWYYRKEILHDPSLWNVAKREFTHNGG